MRKVKYVKRRQRGAAVLLASLILLLEAAIVIEIRKHLQAVFGQRGGNIRP